MKKIGLFILVSLVLKIVNAQNDYNDLEYYQIGCKLLDSLKFNESIFYFNKAIKNNPANTIYYYKRGQAYYKLKNFALAKEDFTFCLQNVANEPTYYQLVGLCNEKLGLTNDALLYYSKAIEMNANEIDFYKSRANLYMKIDSIKPAIIDYSYVLSINTKDGNTYYNRGIAYYKIKKIESACSDWDFARLLSIKGADEYFLKNCKKEYLPKEEISSNDIIVMPTFNKSSYKKLPEFIANHLLFPISASVNCHQGTVIIKFTVKNNGEIANIKVINPVDPDIDNEAIRVIKLTNGLWQGGLINGKPSDIELTFPITFRLEPDCGRGVDYFIRKGLTLFDKSDYKNAIDCFSEVIRRDPYNQEIIKKRIQARTMIHDTIGLKEDMKLLDKKYFQSISYTTNERNDDTLFNVRIFYDSLWNICSQSKATYFRLTKWNTRINFYDGEFNDYLLNGNLICSGNYVNKNKEGAFNYFAKNGSPLIKGVFKNNLPTSIWLFYFDNGKISHKIGFEGESIDFKEINDSIGNNLNKLGNFNRLFVSQIIQTHSMF